MPLLPARRPTEREMQMMRPQGVLRSNLSAIASRLSGGSGDGAKSVPGQNAGWGGMSRSSSLTSAITNYAETYGGDSAITWIYACVTLIMDEMALYPYSFVDTTTSADLGKATPIPYQKVPLELKTLLKQPNERMSWFDAVNWMTLDTELVGNAYWLKDQRNGLGQPLRMMRLRPEFVRIATNDAGEVIGYTYRVKGFDIPYDADEVVHFKLPSPHSEYYGMGRVQGILNDAGAELAINEQVVGFFTNGARISGVLTISGTLPEESFERIKRQFIEEYGGSANAFSVLIAEQGVDFKPITQAPGGSGVVEIRGLSKDAILSGFGVHEEMLGGTGNAGDVKMGDAQTIHSRKMRPRARRFSERFTWDLTALWGDIGIWISTTDVETQEKKVARARDMLGAGATVSESRMEMGLPPVTVANFPHLDEDAVAMANTPILPSGYDPFFVVQQAPGQSPNQPGGNFDEILPGGSNGNISGSGEPTAAVGEGHRNRDAIRTVRALNGKTMLTLPSGRVMPVPDGYEDLGSMEMREADMTDAEALVAIQARIYAEETPEWEKEMTGFFNEQRNRVLRDALKFSDRHTAKRLGQGKRYDKKDMAVERIFHVAAEDELLERAYRARARGVAQRTVNEIALWFDTPPADVRGIVDELAHRVVGINKTTRERIANQIAVGVARGYSTAQIANGVPAENYLGIAGVFDSATEHRAEAIARTEVATVYNMASIASYAQIGVARVEVLDGTMDQGCRDARGKVWTLAAARANPIEHPRCVRSFVPLFEGTGR